MLNIQEQFEVDDSFNVRVVHVQSPPRGSGKPKQYLPGFQSCISLRQVKKSLLVVPQDDQGLCRPRAIIAAIDLQEVANKSKRRAVTYRRRWHKMQPRIYNLLLETGLKPGAWGPEEMAHVMAAPSMQAYPLVVVDGRRVNAPISYGRGDTLIAIYHADHHYDAITKPPAFLGKSYECASIVLKARMIKVVSCANTLKPNSATVMLVSKTTARNTETLG